MLLRWIYISAVTSSFMVWADDSLSGCRQDLGMNSGAIPDSAITASSAYDQKSVGPINARIRTEKNGGAWCPRQQVSKDVHEWLQIDFDDLKVITMVETQGRFGNGQGQEFAQNYTLEYQRENGQRWNRFRDLKGVELFKGNVNTFLAELRELHPPVIARRMRFVPYASHPRTVCMRVELYGCPWPDGTVAYNMRQGDRRGTEMDFYDFTYDGSVEDGYLSDGLGQLTDLEEGNWNFRLDLQNLGKKGYEWMAWKSDNLTGPVEIIFRFDVVRNFSKVAITANNFYTREVSVFRQAHVYFSVGGERYSTDYVVHEYLKDSVLEYARQVAIPLENRIGQFVKLILFFDAKWMMISEIRFTGEKVIETVPVEASMPMPFGAVKNVSANRHGTYIQAPNGGKLNAEPSTMTTSPEIQSNERLAPVTLGSVSESEPRQRLSDTYIGIIVGALAVVITLILVLALFLLLRLHRRSRSSTSNKGVESKCAHASDGIHFTRNDLMQLSDGAAHKLGPSNGSAAYAGGEMSDGTESEKKLALYQNSSTVKVNSHENQMFNQKGRNSRKLSGNGTDGSKSSTTEQDRHAILVTNLPNRPIVQHPVNLNTSNNHLGTVNPRTRNFADLDFTDDPISYNSRPNEKRKSTLDPSACHHSTTNTRRLPIADNIGNAFPQTLLHLKISDKDLKYVMKLGDGKYGEVHLSEFQSHSSRLNDGNLPKMEHQPTLVAVKMLNKNAAPTRKEFFRETALALTLCDPNIVQVLGICRMEECPGVVVEYLRGNLYQYLQRTVPEATSPATTQNHSQVLSYGCLIYMAKQIASAMKYLETLNLVHRDLATRNCLVGHKLTIKISDLGIGPSLYGSDYYRLEGCTAALPIRWMSWEAVILNKFSCKSDIWSFAVTLWEILTYAREQPFFELSNEHILEQFSLLHSNSSEYITFLLQPPNCPKEIFDLMMTCWKREEMHRPSFNDIHTFLQRKNVGYNPDKEEHPYVDYRWKDVVCPKNSIRNSMQIN